MSSQAKAGPVAVALVALSLTGCGAVKRAYVPLTADNFTSAMTAAVQGKTSAHEVSTTDSGTAAIDYDTSGTFRYRMVRTSGTTTSTVIGIGPDAYVQASVGAAWSKGTSPLTAASVNPIGMVTTFSKGVAKFAYLGAATIDGAQVQRYQITIDQAKYLQSLGQGTSSTNLGANEPIVEDLYLNDDNSLRRVSIAMPAGVGNVQLDVTQWGAPVSISAPIQ